MKALPSKSQHVHRQFSKAESSQIHVWVKNNSTALMQYQGAHARIAVTSPLLEDDVDGKCSCHKVTHETIRVGQSI